MKRLLTEASLIMKPEGQADGLLPSVKPIDGSGDFTFSRGSNLAATRVNQAGLIEKGRENLLLQSNQFDTTWSGNNAVAVSGYNDRNGGTSAWLLREQGGNIQHYIRQSSGLTSGIGTFSFYAKKKDYDYIQFSRSGDGGDYANFNISDGTLGNLSGASIIDRKIQSVGDGWYRCSVTYSFGSNSFVGIALIRSDVSSRYEVYQGDNTSGTYIQDSQAEVGTIATDYLDSGATTGKAGILADMPRINYDANGENGALLLEGLRSNIVVSSEYLSHSSWSTSNLYGTITTNASTSPEGLNNATSMVAGATNNVHYFDEATFSATSGVDYTFSFFAKSNGSDFVQVATSSGFLSKYQNYNITTGELAGGNAIAAGYTPTIEPIGSSGWYRVALKATTASANARFLIIPIITDTTRNPSFVGNGDGVFVWGIQKEQAPYASSYIPTHGAAVSRSADSCSVTGVSDVIGQTEGTMFVEFEGINVDGTTYIASLDNGTSNERIELFTYSGNISISVRDGGVQQVNMISSVSADGNHKIAFAYKANDFAFYIDGNLIATDNSGTLPIMSIFNAYGRYDGSSGGGAQNLSQATLFDTRLTNAELATLTTL